jgi:hypothetical protein
MPNKKKLNRSVVIIQHEAIPYAGWLIINEGHISKAWRMFPGSKNKRMEKTRKLTYSQIS